MHRNAWYTPDTRQIPLISAQCSWWWLKLEEETPDIGIYLYQTYTMTVCPVIFMTFICFDESFFVPQSFHILLVLLQVLLTNLQNILKVNVLTTRTEDYQLTKMVHQMVSIHISKAAVLFPFIAYRHIKIKKP